MLNILNEQFITEFYVIIITTLVFVLLTSIWLFYLLKTDLFLKYGLCVYRSMAGMRVKYVPRKCGKGIWCYAEKGIRCPNKPTLVFLHGFGGAKDDWPMIIRRIPSMYHCIIVDMPGHGDTTFVQDYDEPNILSYVEALKEFLEIVELNGPSQIYLIGCSFGGGIAAFYTHKYPDSVKILALMCPAILTPVLTDTCKQVLDGNYDVLIPKTADEFIATINTFCFKTVRVPYKIMQSFVNINYIQRKHLLEKVLKSLVTTDLKKFEEEHRFKFSTIKTRTLILWGKDDEMLHVSGAGFLKEAIENSHVKILDECGHVLQLDQPKRTTQYLLEFLKANL